MVLSGVNQSHVQPIWAEIPSLSENISAGVSTRPFREPVCRLDVEIILRGLSYLSSVVVYNLLREHLNSTLPSPDIQVVMDVNV